MVLFLYIYLYIYLSCSVLFLFMFCFSFSHMHYYNEVCGISKYAGMQETVRFFFRGIVLCSRDLSVYPYRYYWTFSLSSSFFLVFQTILQGTSWHIFPHAHRSLYAEHQAAWLLFILEITKPFTRFFVLLENASFQLKATLKGKEKGGQGKKGRVESGSKENKEGFTSHSTDCNCSVAEHQFRKKCFWWGDEQRDRGFRMTKETSWPGREEQEGWSFQICFPKSLKTLSTAFWFDPQSKSTCLQYPLSQRNVPLELLLHPVTWDMFYVFKKTHTFSASFTDCKVGRGWSPLWLVHSLALVHLTAWGDTRCSVSEGLPCNISTGRRVQDQPPVS